MEYSLAGTPLHYVSCVSMFSRNDFGMCTILVTFETMNHECYTEISENKQNSHLELNNKKPIQSDPIQLPDTELKREAQIAMPANHPQASQNFISNSIPSSYPRISNSTSMSISNPQSNRLHVSTSNVNTFENRVDSGHIPIRQIHSMVVHESSSDVASFSSTNSRESLENQRIILRPHYILPDAERNRNPNFSMEPIIFDDLLEEDLERDLERIQKFYIERGAGHLNRLEHIQNKPQEMKDEVIQTSFMIEPGSSNQVSTSDILECQLSVSKTNTTHKTNKMNELVESSRAPFGVQAIPATYSASASSIASKVSSIGYHTRISSSSNISHESDTHSIELEDIDNVDSNVDVNAETNEDSKSENEEVNVNSENKLIETIQKVEKITTSKQTIGRSENTQEKVKVLPKQHFDQIQQQNLHHKEKKVVNNSQNCSIANANFTTVTQPPQREANLSIIPRRQTRSSSVSQNQQYSGSIKKAPSNRPRSACARVIPMKGTLRAKKKQASTKTEQLQLAKESSGENMGTTTSSEKSPKEIPIADDTCTINPPEMYIKNQSIIQSHQMEALNRDVIEEFGKSAELLIEAKDIITNHEAPIQNNHNNHVVESNLHQSDNEATDKSNMSVQLKNQDKCNAITTQLGEGSCTESISPMPHPQPQATPQDRYQPQLQSQLLTSLNHAHSIHASLQYKLNIVKAEYESYIQSLKLRIAEKSRNDERTKSVMRWLASELFVLHRERAAWKVQKKMSSKSVLDQNWNEIEDTDDLDYAIDDDYQFLKKVEKEYIRPSHSRKWRNEKSVGFLLEQNLELQEENKKLKTLESLVSSNRKFLEQSTKKSIILEKQLWKLENLLKDEMNAKEHIQREAETLEETNQKLFRENATLNDLIQSRDDRIESLEREMEQLKRKVKGQQLLENPMSISNEAYREKKYPINTETMEEKHLVLLPGENLRVERGFRQLLQFDLPKEYLKTIKILQNAFRELEEENLELKVREKEYRYALSGKYL